MIVWLTSCVVCFSSNVCLRTYYPAWLLLLLTIWKLLLILSNALYSLDPARALRLRFGIALCLCVCPTMRSDYFTQHSNAPKLVLWSSTLDTSSYKFASIWIKKIEQILTKVVDNWRSNFDGFQLWVNQSKRYTVRSLSTALIWLAACFCGIPLILCWWGNLSINQVDFIAK